MCAVYGDRGENQENTRIFALWKKYAIIVIVMSTTEFNITSPTNLAQSIAHKKTPIVVAIAEYVRSLMHNNPDTPYAFGEVKQGVREHV
jgi:dTDP-4-dehydrorhamnose reductase